MLHVEFIIFHQLCWEMWGNCCMQVVLVYNRDVQIWFPLSFPLPLPLQVVYRLDAFDIFDYITNQMRTKPVRGNGFESWSQIWASILCQNHHSRFLIVTPMKDSFALFMKLWKYWWVVHLLIFRRHDSASQLDNY
jgi:hypothetical protein